jgi:hypothetical protein
MVRLCPVVGIGRFDASVSDDFSHVVRFCAKRNEYLMVRPQYGNEPEQYTNRGERNGQSRTKPNGKDSSEGLSGIRIRHVECSLVLFVAMGPAILP